MESTVSKNTIDQTEDSNTLRWYVHIANVPRPINKNARVFNTGGSDQTVDSLIAAGELQSAVIQLYLT